VIIPISPGTIKLNLYNNTDCRFKLQFAFGFKAHSELLKLSF